MTHRHHLDNSDTLNAIEALARDYNVSPSAIALYLIEDGYTFEQLEMALSTADMIGIPYSVVLSTMRPDELIMPPSVPPPLPRMPVVDLDSF